MLTPTTKDLPIAPEHILQRIKCQCKSDCKSGNCSSKRVSLFCSKDCGCNDDECINMQSISEEADSEDGLDYYDTEDL